MIEMGVAKCDLCRAVVKGDNSDSWAAQLPVLSILLTEDEVKARLKRSKYSITQIDVCFPCKDKLGDWVVSQKT
jgi:hypothetical protein